MRLHFKTDYLSKANQPNHMEIIFVVVVVFYELILNEWLLVGRYGSYTTSGSVTMKGVVALKIRSMISIKEVCPRGEFILQQCLAYRMGFGITSINRQD
jgi:hypothetical protein